MERVRPQKKQVQVTHVAVAPEAQADVPGVTKVVERVRPTKPVPDPKDRPQYRLDGYGEPVRAFTIGMAAKKGPGDRVVVRYRKRGDAEGEVRVYYAGACLLGSVTISPLGNIVAHFHHNLGEAQYTTYKTLDSLHEGLRNLLQVGA